jgi:hypothetical protein
MPRRRASLLAAPLLVGHTDHDLAVAPARRLRQRPKDRSAGDATRLNEFETDAFFDRDDADADRSEPPADALPAAPQAAPALP